MKIYKVDGHMVRDYTKLSRKDVNTVLIGIVDGGYRRHIPIIGDGGMPFEGEDSFEVVRYTEEELKARQEARSQKDTWIRAMSRGEPFDPARHNQTADLYEADFRLGVVPASDDARVLVNWRVFNCQKFEGTAEVLTEVALPFTYREDDGAYDVSQVNQRECLAIFKPGDTLRTVPIDPRGMYYSAVSNSYSPGYIHNMRWMMRGTKPFLSVRRRPALKPQKATV